jgi:hypothetical protein
MSVNHQCADCHLYIDPFAKMQKTQGKIPPSNLYTHVPSPLKKLRNRAPFDEIPKTGFL